MDNEVIFFCQCTSTKEVVKTSSNFALVHLTHNRAGVLSQITPVIIVRPAAAKYCEKLFPCTQAGIAVTYTVFYRDKNEENCDFIDSL